jgi:hypothetical protein
VSGSTPDSSWETMDVATTEGFPSLLFFLRLPSNERISEQAVVAAYTSEPLGPWGSATECSWVRAFPTDARVSLLGAHKGQD